MSRFEPQDPDFEARVRRSFAKQPFMATIGARLAHVAPGEIEIELSVMAALLQQHGFVHGGVVATVADTACGYAALSLMPAGVGVLTVEFKINFMAPAAGARLRASGRVAKPARTVSVTQAEVHAEAEDGAEPTLVSVMTATLMILQGRPGVVD